MRCKTTKRQDLGSQTTTIQEGHVYSRKNGRVSRYIQVHIYSEHASVTELAKSRSFVEFFFGLVHHCKTPDPKAASFALLRARVLWQQKNQCDVVWANR